MNQTVDTPPTQAQPDQGQAFWEHALTPHNLGVLPPPAHQAQARGSCGDSLELFLRVEDGLISQARFLSQGCHHTVACGSALTTLVQGASLEKAFLLTPGEVSQALGGLPREHQHCAALAVLALRRALQNYYRDRQHPWKGLYGRP